MVPAFILKPSKGCLTILEALPHVIDSNQRWLTFRYLITVCVMHRNKGRTLFIVYVQPVWGIQNICSHLITVFYLTQPSSKRINCFDFEKQNTYTYSYYMWLGFMCVCVCVCVYVCVCMCVCERERSLAV